jgi:tryptophan 2,3-dioxygenase
VAGWEGGDGDREVRTLNPSQTNPRLRYEFDRGSGYETEIRLTTALSALIPEDELLHSDHRFFQIVHLLTEYCWVAVHHCLCDLTEALGRGDTIAAGRLLVRCADTAALTVECLRVMANSLTQVSFLRMRDDLAGAASGLASPGSRNVRRAAHAVWAAFESAAADAGATPADLVEGTAPDTVATPRIAQLADVMVGLQRFDTQVLEWKQVHLNLVWQMLGGQPRAADEEDEGAPGRPRSMRGRSISDLERLAVRPLFPKLWLQNTAVYRAMSAVAPGEEAA